MLEVAGALDGSLIVGGGAVWVVDTDRGVLDALDDPATGTPRACIDVGQLPYFASPHTVVGEHAYLGTTSGVVAISV